MARILYVNRGKLGGPSNSLLMLLTHVKHKHDNRVWVSDPGEFEKVLSHHNIPFNSSHIRYRSIPALYSTLHREKIDLVYANSFTASAWRALIAAKLARCKYIWHIREIMTVDSQNSYSLRRRVRFADQVIAVSEACRRSVKAIAPLTPVTVVYNGINLNDFQYDRKTARQYISQQLGVPDDHKIMVSVGTFNQRKNQREAILAVRNIIRENPKICFLLIGESGPSYQAELSTIIENSDLRDNIYLLGFRKDVSKILCGADLFIHTAVVDPHPRAVLEAMGAGLPVIAYDVDGVSETVVDSEHGYLVPVGNVVLMEQRIRKILNQGDLGDIFGQNGRKRIQNCFSAEQTAANILDVIDKVLNGEKVE